MEVAARAELVFIPTPGMGHLVSTVEIAKLLIQRDDRLSITVFIMKNPFDSNLNGYTQSLTSSSSSNRIRFIALPDIQPDESKTGRFMGPIIEAHKPQVAQILTDLVGSGTRIAGFVLDMFCTSFIDTANQFGIPSYIFFTSGAAFLDFMFLAQQLNDEQRLDLKPDSELTVPSFRNPLPVRCFPTVVLNNEWFDDFCKITRQFKEAKGIMVNTFLELEPQAVQALQVDSKISSPPVYPVGPILNLKPADEKKQSSSIIMEWLDEQPAASVVFLCFGSMGSFGEEQVQEIAHALEKSGHRFLWSLRKPQAKGVKGLPTEYTDFQEVLPEGFLDRTASVGKVIGWAPQTAALAHPAVGGFVSHCGWNSTLESVWCGVPIAAWPLYAEQQFNAFELVVELGLAEEIQMDYRGDVFVQVEEKAASVVSAEKIENAIRKVMEEECEVRKKAKEMSEASRNALVEGGSSYVSLGRFIDNVMLDMP